MWFPRAWAKAAGVVAEQIERIKQAANTVPGAKRQKADHTRFGMLFNNSLSICPKRKGQAHPRKQLRIRDYITLHLQIVQHIEIAIQIVVLIERLQISNGSTRLNGNRPGLRRVAGFDERDASYNRDRKRNREHR